MSFPITQCTFVNLCPPDLLLPPGAIGLRSSLGFQQIRSSIALPSKKIVDASHIFRFLLWPSSPLFTWVLRSPRIVLSNIAHHFRWRHFTLGKLNMSLGIRPGLKVYLVSALMV